jgi:hypothetical protein
VEIRQKVKQKIKNWKEKPNRVVDKIIRFWEDFIIVRRERGAGETKNHQIWLNLPSDDHHFFCIFLRTIGNLATNKKKNPKRTLDKTAEFFPA